MRKQKREGRRENARWLTSWLGHPIPVCTCTILPSNNDLCRMREGLLLLCVSADLLLVVAVDVAIAALSVLSYPYFAHFCPN